MTVYLSSAHHAQLLSWADEAGPLECCGLLLGDGAAITAVVRADNVAPDPGIHFEIDPAALIGAHKHKRNGGPDIIGYFHSHPNGLERPSATDIEMANADGKYWLIIANGRISAWSPVAACDRPSGFRPLLLTVQG